METKYQTIKNSVRKGLAGAMLGVSLLGGASAYAAQKYSLPINQETTEVIQKNMQKESIAEENKINSNLQAYFQTYNQKTQEAQKVFNTALEDRVFTTTEQKKVYGLLDDAVTSINSANNYLRMNGINRLYKVSQSTKDLYQLVYSTSKTQQKILKNKGLSVKVERSILDESNAQATKSAIGGVIALLLIHAVGEMPIRVRKRKEE
jgi:hypothetical protein